MFGKALKSFAYAPPPPSVPINLTGKRVAVVGGTDGLGRAIARLAAASSASVTVVGRTFKDASVPNLHFMRADLSLMSEATRIGQELPANLDAVVMTTGILAGPARVLSREGIEIDMAVSALSRHVLLKALMPRLPQATRTFIMGMPGSNQWQEPVDLNSETTYAGSFGSTHAKTVVANEALVLHWAAANRLVYGLNPGLISTNIRGSVYGGRTWLASLMEHAIGLFSVTPDRYAHNVVPLFTAPELADRPGLMFGQSGRAILPTPQLTDAARLSAWMRALDDLAATAADAGSRASASAAAAAADAADARS